MLSKSPASHSVAADVRSHDSMDVRSFESVDTSCVGKFLTVAKT